MTERLSEVKKLLTTIGKIDPEFPLQWVLVFLEIAANEGASIKDISKKTGISLSVMSRTIGALSDNRRGGNRPPYGLITVKHSVTDKRRKELYLSKKGQKLARELENRK